MSDKLLFVAGVSWTQLEWKARTRQTEVCRTQERNMSVEFRPRTLGEYANIARKRKWLILLPTIAIGLAIAYAVYRLPDVYESVTLIVVKPSTLPNTVVPTIAEETLTRELT